MQSEKTKRTQIARDEFSRRLQGAMNEKGWNQTEMAKQAQLYMAEGRMERDIISTYVRAKALPSPVKLAAIASALGKTPEDLMPARAVPVGMRAASRPASTPAKEMRDLGDGNAWLTINQAVPYRVALKILTMLEPEDNDGDDI